jgi:phytoene synthase
VREQEHRPLRVKRRKAAAVRWGAPEAKRSPPAVWSADQWETKFRLLRGRVAAAPSEEKAWLRIAAQARIVLRTFSTSFFLVTRFLPAEKRRQVEVIYAVVRYPDELVDTFAPAGLEVGSRLHTWEEDYCHALEECNLRQAVANGVNPFLAAFATIVKRTRIPHQHYRDFLRAMSLDLEPRSFCNLRELIDEYVYGSAVVVGYFLTHVYGANCTAGFPRALACARDLGIALQLTNFARDVQDDQRRGRIYIPQDILAAAGGKKAPLGTAAHEQTLSAAQHQLAQIAEDYYERAAPQLDAFAPDSRVAIGACIRVYRQLNDQILTSKGVAIARHSVPTQQKFRALPASKYWRLPLAYMGWI